MFRISPRLINWYWKCNPSLFHWDTAFFLKNGLACFLGSFFYIAKHIWLNIGPAVRPFVSPSVRQSVSPLFKNNLACFEKCSTDLLGSFFYIVKHICLNIGPAVRQSVVPSFRHSVSPLVRQSFEFAILFWTVPRFWLVLEYSICHACSKTSFLLNIINVEFI